MIDLPEDQSLERYILNEMCSEEHVNRMGEGRHIKKKRASYAATAERLLTGDNPVKLDEIRKTARQIWKPCDYDFHLEILKSRQLEGHDWCGAAPSRLHLTLQTKVREFLNSDVRTTSAFEELLETGRTVMKHEYFILATHDLIETKLIEGIPKVIPSTRARSLSDFVFNGLPFDLKHTNDLAGYTRESVRNNLMNYAKTQVEKADRDRERKKADASINHWGHNRFFVLVEDPSRWHSDPERLLEEIADTVRELGDPTVVEFDRFSLSAYVVAV